jgi:hypothetical protein
LKKSKLINFFLEDFNVKDFSENNHRRWLEPCALKKARWVLKGDLDSNVLI